MNYEGELMSTLSELKMYALARRGGLSYRIYRNLNVGGSEGSALSGFSTFRRGCVGVAISSYYVTVL